MPECPGSEGPTVGHWALEDAGSGLSPLAPQSRKLRDTVSHHSQRPEAEGFPALRCVLFGTKGSPFLRKGAKRFPAWPCEG